MHLQTVKIHGHPVGYHAGGAGPALVLIHGIAGSSRTWRQVVPRLSQQFTVVAPDLLGHGASAKLRGDYSLGAHASGVRDLMVALGIDRATMVGHSLGGGVAMQFAYQFPERVERLVLVDSGGLGEEVALLLRMLTVPGAEYILPFGCRPEISRAIARGTGWLERIGVRPSTLAQEIWNGYVSLGSADSRNAFLQTLRAVVDVTGQRVSATDRLYLTQDVPTMIVWGDRDPLIPVTHARRAHRSIRGSVLKIYRNVGHFPHCDEPDRFVDDLVAFVNSTASVHRDEGQWRDLIRNKTTTAARRSGRRATPRRRVDTAAPVASPGGPSTQSKT
ncbi:MAG: alpha/beta fold hydrolase [Candidatus Dormibacteria bacterium]